LSNTSLPTGSHLRCRTKIIHVTTIDMSIRLLLLPLLLNLKSAGYDVRTACAAGPWRSEIESLGIPVQPVALSRRISPFQDLIAIGQLCAFFRKERPVIVHTHTPKANLLGRLAARMAGVPVVLGTEHGFYFYKMQGLARAFHVYLARLGAQLADATMVTNQEDYDTSLRERIIESSKLVYQVGGLGVDLGRFKPTIDGSGVRSSLGIPPDALVVGFVGRLTPEKGCTEFVEAAALVQREIEHVHFLIIGPSEGDTRSKLEKLVSSLHLDHRVHFLGARTDVSMFYAAMDLFTLPSYREGVGLVLEEAAAMGKPVVATDVRGCSEVVVVGETGLLVPPRDSAQLAEAILRLLRDADLRQQMGKAARQRAERVFDQLRVANEMDTLYQRLLNKKGLS
jgi:glycosyltransferase involved in cell wall biosynthesis